MGHSSVTYWSGMVLNVVIRISHLIERMVVVRFGLDTKSGLCDNWRGRNSIIKGGIESMLRA